MLYKTRFLLEDRSQGLQHHQTLHMVPLSVGIIAAGELKQLIVDLPVHIRETSKQWGLSEHNSRQFNVK